MTNFFDTYAAAPPPVKSAPPKCTGQGDLAGVCEFCGFAGEDIIIGVCAECAGEEREE